MAQTRTFKIGTVYSRVRSLLQANAMKVENKPVWFDIYEAFPPKYEPRIDRHMLPYGNGGNVDQMPPPPKLLYAEDVLRAKYYKVFMPSDEKVDISVASTEVFDLFEKSDRSARTLSQVFIDKHEQLAKTESIKGDVFQTTIEALELEGIHLTKPPREAFKIEAENEGPRMKAPSMKEIFSSVDDEKK
jgi:small subunit ribosomal protein S23